MRRINTFFSTRYQQIHFKNSSSNGSIFGFLSHYLLRSRLACATTVCGFSIFATHFYFSAHSNDAIDDHEGGRIVKKGPFEQLIDETTDLSRCPQQRPDASPWYEYTIGDLHGNALSLIRILVRENILILSNEDYEKIFSIYHKNSNDLTKDDINVFNTLLSKSIIRKPKIIRFIGDETADRGRNDYFMLKIFEKLALSHVKFDILFSNHGYEFIKAMEGGLLPEASYSYLEKHKRSDGNSYARSLTGLRDLVLREIISFEEVLTLYKNIYVPHLKILSIASHIRTANEYNHPFPILSRYAHADINSETVKGLATFLGIKYQDQTPEQLRKTIQICNEQFLKCAKAGKLSEWAIYVEQKNHPLRKIIWTRDFDEPFDRPRNYALFSIHGHDGAGTVPKQRERQVLNLDSDFGKSEENMKGSRTLVARN